MNTHFFKTAFRFVRRNKVFTAINMVGLSLALTVSFIILLYVINELSYNRFLKNNDKLYRVTLFNKAFDTHDTGTPYVFATGLTETLPQIDKVVRTRRVRKFSIKRNEEWLDVNEAIASEPDIFPLFEIDLHGESKECLNGMNTIVLSYDLANKIFADKDPLGQEVTCLINGEEQLMVVKGLYKNLPVNSSFQSDCFIDIQWTVNSINKAYEPYGMTNVEQQWDFPFWGTWVLLKSNVDVAQFQKTLAETTFGNKDQLVFGIQSYKDAYLYSDVWGGRRVGNLQNIKIFSSIALLILLAASFNYVILSTVISTTRSKEIAIRKTIGATKANTSIQIFGESVLMAFMSLPLAVVFMMVFKPFAEKLFQTDLTIIQSNIALYLMAYVGITLMIGIISGSYLNFYLARLNVIDILKNKRIARRKPIFRNALVLFQLVVFSVLISSMLVIRTQYQYGLNYNSGYEKDNIIVLDIGEGLKDYQILLDRLRTNPNVLCAGGTYFSLPMDPRMSSMYPSFEDESVSVKVDGMAVDYDFIEAMGLLVKEGRSFSKESGNDLQNAVILNEKAVQMLGIHDPVGKKLLDKTIIGVIKDFNLYSLRDAIPPLTIEIVDSYLNQIAIRYRENSLPLLLPFIKEQWNKLGEDRPFSYSTINDITASLYTDEQNLNSIVSIFSLVALFITALGLFGLILFVGKQHTKEIGIRKVMGCSRASIIYLFMTKNIQLATVSIIISIPLTFYFMTDWLNNFQYKINFPWWVFMVAFVALIVVVVSTIFYHSYKASSANPVDALRYE
nr:FtsX-like permease family protein [uncultured Carboxylicivirga sp.]